MSVIVRVGMWIWRVQRESISIIILKGGEVDFAFIFLDNQLLG